MRPACACIGMLLISASALAGLGPEVPLAPADSPGASQLQVRVAEASGHLLAVWSDGQLRGSLDGAPVDLQIAGVPASIIGIGAGSKNFLIAYQIQMQTSPYYTPVLALRVGFDGRVLDSAPIMVDADTHGVRWGGNVAYDGSDFVVVTMEKHTYPSIIWADTIVTGRVSEDGVAGGNVRLTYSSTSGEPRWPRIAWAADHFVIGYSAVFFGSEGITAFGLSDLTLRPEDSGNRQLPDSQFPDAPGTFPAPAIAVGYDRVTFAWMNATFRMATTVDIAQTDLDGRPLLQPTAIAVVAPPPGLAGDNHVEIAWDGQSYLVVWTPAEGPNPGPISALHLTYGGKVIDRQPLVIADSANGDFSLSPMRAGFVVGYSRTARTTFRAYTRTIDDAGTPRRRAAR